MHEIRPIKPEELKDTLALIRSVFSEFEAPDYSEQGVETFLEFTELCNIQQGIGAGELCFWVYIDMGRITGAIAIKNSSHICMLFVDKSHHRKGIATKLLKTALDGTDGNIDITVNSSPYAVPFYHAVGFTDTDDLTTRDGIKYVPMLASRNELLLD